MDKGQVTAVLLRLGFQDTGERHLLQRQTPTTNILVDFRRGNVLSIWNGKTQINRRYHEELLERVDEVWLEQRIAFTTLTQLAERHFSNEQQSLSGNARIAN